MLKKAAPQTALVALTLAAAACGNGAAPRSGADAAVISDPCASLAKAAPDYGITSILGDYTMDVEGFSNWLDLRSDGTAPILAYPDYSNLRPTDVLTLCVAHATELAPPGPPQKDGAKANTVILVVLPDGSFRVDAMGAQEPILKEFALTGASVNGNT